MYPFEMTFSIQCIIWQGHQPNGQLCSRDDKKFESILKMQTGVNSESALGNV